MQGALHQHVSFGLGLSLYLFARLIADGYGRVLAKQLRWRNARTSSCSTTRRRIWARRHKQHEWMGWTMMCRYDLQAARTAFSCERECVYADVDTAATGQDAEILKSFLCGFYRNVAVLNYGQRSYRTFGDSNLEEVYIHPSSCLHQVGRLLSNCVVNSRACVVPAIPAYDSIHRTDCHG